jgi:cytochrome P450
MVRQTIQPYLNPWFAVSGELRRHEEMRARADGILLDYIRQRRQEAPGHDLLQILMDARYSDGEGMSDELVLSESMQLLVAGHETSSNALSWLLYLLSSRPDCLERLRQEFDSVLGGAPLSYSDVPKLSLPLRSFRRRCAFTRRSGWSTGWPLRTTAWGISPYPGVDGDCVRLRRAPFAPVLGEPGEFRSGALHQSE